MKIQRNKLTKSRGLISTLWVYFLYIANWLCTAAAVPIENMILFKKHDRKTTTPQLYCDFTTYIDIINKK